MMFGLGLIPDWQFSDDPRVNINLNPHVQIPADWPYGQRTVQPVGAFPWRAAGDPLAPTGGMTITPDASLGCCNRVPAVAGARVTGLGITRARWMEQRADLRGIDAYNWAWQYRKPLIIGGVGLLALAALAGVGAILR